MEDSPKPTRTPTPPVLFEDQWLIAFDKPDGMLVAPDRWDKTLENLMVLIHQRISPAIFNIHRLDRAASGIVLCSKDRETLNKLMTMVQTGTIHREYFALTRGVPKEERGSIRLNIGPDPRFPGRMRVVSHGGKKCVTDYEVVERWQGYALLKVVLQTGRTHQIRVHLAGIGAPLVADRFYGDGRGLFLSTLKPGYKQHAERDEIPLLGRLGLHACRLALVHPQTQQPVTIESPLPKKFFVAMKYLRRYAP